MKITEYSELGFNKENTKEEEGFVGEILFRFAEEDKADLQEAVDIFKKSMSTLFGVSVIKEKSDGL